MCVMYKTKCFSTNPLSFKIEFLIWSLSLFYFMLFSFCVPLLENFQSMQSNMKIQKGLKLSFWNMLLTMLCLSQKDLPIIKPPSIIITFHIFFSMLYIKQNAFLQPYIPLKYNYWYGLSRSFILCLLASVWLPERIWINDFINELNAVNDLYFADRLEFIPSEHEFAVENFECDNDEDDDWCCMRFYRAIGAYE
jgi:hypothetical protein